MPTNLAHLFELSYGHNPAWFSALCYHCSQRRRLRFPQIQWALYGLLTTEIVIYAFAMLSGIQDIERGMLGLLPWYQQFRYASMSSISQYKDTELRLFSKESLAVRMCLSTFCSGNKKRALGKRKGYSAKFTVWDQTLNVTAMLIIRADFVMEGGVGVIEGHFSIHYKQMLAPCSKPHHQPWRILKLCWGVSSFFFFLSSFSCFIFWVTAALQLLSLRGQDWV